jgi:hypothetical protein
MAGAQDLERIGLVNRKPLKLPSHLDWQPIRWIPVGAVVEVCDERGFIRDAMLSRVGAPLQVFGGALEGRATHWRWRFDGRQWEPKAAESR